MIIITKAASGLAAVCMARAARLFRAVSGAIAALMHRRRFVDRPEDLVDGATYEFLHKSSSVVRTFFKDASRAKAYNSMDTFTLADDSGNPGLRSFQHLISASAWHNAETFFGEDRTARIRLVA